MNLSLLLSAMSPTTGDDSNIKLWVVLLAVAALGVVAMIMLGKGKRK